MKDLHITKKGILLRKENTLYFINKEEKIPIPIENIYQIFAHEPLTIKSGALLYLAKRGIVVHFFNSYGFYEGTFYPRDILISGDITVKQAEHYLNFEKRMYLAKKFVEGSMKNMIRTIDEYKIKQKEEIEEILELVDKRDSIVDLMNIEGRSRIIYYSSFDNIIKSNEFKFEYRSKRPPKNELNALISFGNSLLYTVILSEIYHTQLNPTISYLHEPFERRFSLSLDVSEIFKPLIVDRLIIYLINKKMIKKSDFEIKLKGIRLREKARKLFLKEFEKRLSTTIKHRSLKRKVSYRHLIRLECYKLIKHLINEKKYKPFVIWW